MRRRWGLLTALALPGLLAGTASAQTFDGGLPAAWGCIGNCGTSGADGDIGLVPGGGSQYGFVSTTGGTFIGGLGPGIGSDGTAGSGTATNGSVLVSNVFAANAGDALEFNFNFITSDGSGYADYAWARLLNAGDLTEAALIFTARTTPDGNSVPGFGMPAVNANLTPPDVVIQDGLTTWSHLGAYSGACFNGVGQGCGVTGWVFSSFMIAGAGNYLLEFGVTNWGDSQYDSGLAFDGLTVGGAPIEDGGPGAVVPEPITMILMGTGLAGVGAVRRRRRHIEVAEI